MLKCRLGTVFLGTALCLVGTTGCANPETDFQNASEANTVEAYESFLQRHPETDLAAKALDRLCALELDSAVAAHTVDALTQVLERCGKTELAATVAQAIRMIEQPIVFVSGRDGNPEVYAMDADGSHQRNLTNDPGEDLDPAWSPDHARIVFVSNRAGNRDLYLMDADGGGVTQLTDGPEIEASPAWSPDGARIAFSSAPDDQTNDEIFVIGVDGSGRKNLTNHPAWDITPAWSPDSEEIVFATFREDDLRLAVMRSNGSDLRLLEAPSRISWDPDWSPDGQQIAFVSGSVSAGKKIGQIGMTATTMWVGVSFFGAEPVVDDIGIVNVDGSDSARIGGESNERSPRWSAEGDRIIFVSYVGDNSEIFSMAPDGSAITNLSDAAAADYSPDT